MGSGGVIGALKALLSLETAQFIGDTGKVQQAARAVRRDIQSMGDTAPTMDAISGKVGGIGKAFGGMKPSLLAASGAMKLAGDEMSGAVGKVAKGLTGLVSGGFSPLGIAVAAGAVGIAHFVGEYKTAMADLDKATEEHAKSISEHLTSMVKLRAEKFDAENETHFAPIAEAAKRVQVAQEAIDQARRKQTALEAELADTERKSNIAGVVSGPAGKWATMTVLGAQGTATDMLKATHDVTKAIDEKAKALDALAAATQGAALAEDKSIRDMQKRFTQLAEDRDLARAGENMSAPFAAADKQIQAFKRQLDDEVKKVGISKEAMQNWLKARTSGMSPGLAQAFEFSDDKDWANVKKLAQDRADAEVRAAKALADQSGFLREQAAATDLKPWEERSRAAAVALYNARFELKTTAEEVTLEREMAQIQRQIEGSTGVARDTAEQKLTIARYVLRITREQHALEAQHAGRDVAKGITDSLTGHDLAMTDRAKALQEADIALQEKLRELDKKGIPADSSERADVVEAGKRQVASITAEYDDRATKAEQAFVEKIAAIRRSAQAAVLVEDQDVTSRKLESDKAAHDAELRELTEAVRKGDLTEEQAAKHREDLVAAHEQARQGIIRDGREKELARIADYQKRLLVLERQGQTGQEDAAREETRMRLAQFDEDTRVELEKLRTRGELSRAQEYEDAAAAARARIVVARQIEERDAAARDRSELVRRRSNTDDVGGAFTARVQEIAQDEATLGRYGARLGDMATHDLSDGVAKALDDVRNGSKTAKEAFGDFARDFSNQVVTMTERVLILQAISAGLGGLFGPTTIKPTTTGPQAAGFFPAGVASANGTAAAFGGTWKVGGYGGIDSQLVRMKLSPGELVTVSGGAGSTRGEGGFYGTLVVRPPAVVADEVAARMNPESKAAIVYSATRRSGRRGSRARD